MSIKKRIISAALTAAMVASLPTAAYASGEKLELVIDTETPIQVCSCIGENKYLYDNEDGDRLLISITEDDIADFAESGEFSYTEIANLNELFECADDEYVTYASDNTFKNGYAQLIKDNDGVISRYCVHCDGDELSIIGKYTDQKAISSNGYIAKGEIVDTDNDGYSESIHFSITAPDGEKSGDLTFGLGMPMDSWAGYLFPHTGNNIYYLVSNSWDRVLILYIISETGEVEKINLSYMRPSGGFIEANDEFIMFSADEKMFFPIFTLLMKIN